MKKINNIFIMFTVLVGNVFMAYSQAKNTALCEAIVKGDETIVDELIKSGINLNSREEGGTTALHAAAFMGHLDIIKKLLKGGANPNVQDEKHKWTPLHYAIYRGHDHLLMPLIEAGADVTFQDEENKTPPDLIGKNDETMVNSLITAIAEYNPDQLDVIIKKFILENRTLSKRVCFIADEMSDAALDAITLLGPIICLYEIMFFFAGP